MDSKTCGRCHRELPGGDFYRCSRSRSGLAAWCKSCAGAASRSWAKSNPDRVRAAQDRSRKKNAAKRSQNRKDWYQRNREREIAKTAAWIAANPEKKRGYDQINYQRNRDKRIAAAAEWAARNPARANEIKRAYSSRNPDVTAHTEQRRRHAIRGLARTLTRAEWAAILDMFARSCAYCLRATKVERDHVIPVCSGGAFSAENIVPACGHCNKHKSRSAAERFLAACATRLSAPLLKLREARWQAWRERFQMVTVSELPVVRSV
jgi:hypothetical protein